MTRHLKYFSYVARHKWFVFLACLKLGVPLWSAICHDWDKFLPSMWIPYVNFFHPPHDGYVPYGALAGMGIFPKTKDELKLEFAKAWNAHQKRNKHHWQFWMLTWDKGDTECLPMPDAHRREMLADWIGAGRALGLPDTKAWYLKNREKIKLHHETRAWIEEQLNVNVDK